MGENYKKYLKKGSAFLVAPALFGGALPGGNASAVFSFDDVKKFFGKVFSMEWIYAIWRMIKFGESEEKKGKKKVEKKVEKKVNTKIQDNSMKQKEGMDEETQNNKMVEKKKIHNLKPQSKNDSVPLVNKVKEGKPNIQEVINKKVDELRKDVSSFDRGNRKIKLKNGLEFTYSWQFYQGDLVLYLNSPASPGCPLLCLPDKGESVLFLLNMYDSVGHVVNVLDFKNAVVYRPKSDEKSCVNGKLSSINYKDPNVFINLEFKQSDVDADFCNAMSCLACLKIIKEQDEEFWALKDQFKPIVSNSLNNNNVGFMNQQQQVVPGFNNNNFLGNPGYNNVGMMNNNGSMMPQVYPQQNMPQNMPQNMQQNMQQGNNNFNGGYPNQQGGGYNQNYNNQFQMMIPQQ